MILETKFELLHGINCVSLEIHLVISGFKLTLREFFIIYFAQEHSMSLNLKCGVVLSFQLVIGKKQVSSVKRRGLQ